MPITPSVRQPHSIVAGGASPPSTTLTPPAATPAFNSGRGFGGLALGARSRHALPDALAGMPRRHALGTRAAAHAGKPQPSNRNETLAQALARKGLPIPASHPGFSMQAVHEVRIALTTLCKNSDPHRAPPESIRRACVQGYKPHFDAVLCLIKNKVLDPNARGPRNPAGETLLHSIAMEGSDDMDHAPGYVTLAGRVRQLTEAGTEINARDHWSNLTALDFAMLRDEKYVIAALRKYGGLTSDELELCS